MKKKQPKKRTCRFVAWITHPKTGERIYAKDHGLRGFPIGN